MKTPKTIKNKKPKERSPKETSPKERSPKNKTIKKTTLSNKVKSKLVVCFMELLNFIKLYHWKTKVFSQHKATDELHEKLSENIDQFVEVLLGKEEKRIKQVDKKIRFYDFNNKLEFKDRLLEYREFLIGLTMLFDSSDDTDLLNIRDEMLANINQFLYLMTFDRA